MFFVFVATIVALLLANEIEKAFIDWKYIIGFITAALFGSLLFLLIRFIFRKYKIPTRNFLVSQDLVSGFGFGLLAFGLVFLPLFLSKEIIFHAFDPKEILFQITFQSRSAVVEEIGFRLGLVLLSFHFFGRTTALVVGSIPFGVLHLLNFLSGQPIFWEYIIGTSMAGLFLSLIFLNFNLGAAIACHYVWNILAASTAKYSNVSQEQIEGGPVTMVVLAGLSAFLYYRVNGTRRKI